MVGKLQIRPLMILAMILLAAAGVVAQAFGRVTVIVTNERGTPLEGVIVRVTSDEIYMEWFRDQMTTNKKGKATFSFTDATKQYEFKFLLVGYTPVDLAIKPQIRGSITRKVVMSDRLGADKGAQETRDFYFASERLFAEGVEAKKAGDLAMAKSKFLEALGMYDKLAVAHLALAGVYLDERDYPAALDAAQRYRKFQPNNTNGLFMLYDVQRAFGNQQEADAVLEQLKAMDKGGDTIAVLYNAGVAAIRLGNYAGAKARFLGALEMHPSHPHAMKALVLIYFSEKNYREAAIWSEKHLLAVPGDTHSMRIRWETYTELGEKEKEKKAFDEFAAADPKGLGALLYDKGNRHFEDGNTEAASARFEQVLEVDPEFAKAHYLLGVCYISTGNYEGAKKHLQKFVDMAPDDPQASDARDMLSAM